MVGAVSRHAALVRSVLLAMHQQTPSEQYGHGQTHRCPAWRSSHATTSAINWLISCAAAA